MIKISRTVGISLIILKKLALTNKTKQFINEFIFTENQADILEDITQALVVSAS